MDKSYHCPVEVTVEILGGKWKSRILWELHHTPLRFGELNRKVPAITKKMLAQCLQELERDELIIRSEYHEKVLRVEYELSDYGRSTIPLISHMSSWGSQHLKRENIGAKRKSI
ncbi:helix-turn-helix domain-containing protein [Bacillus carboniphilus]|uniref:Helix-turn-helix domain-containing protein n=1 Tax=Bacillus carboniphilus TaxID=86663 RepID=A0ABP3FRT0_9BACI